MGTLLVKRVCDICFIEELLQISIKLIETVFPKSNNSNIWVVKKFLHETKEQQLLKQHNIISKATFNKKRYQVQDRSNIFYCCHSKVEKEIIFEVMMNTAVVFK